MTESAVSHSAGTSHRNVSAIHYGEEIAGSIVTTQARADLRDEILRLYIFESRTTAEIAERLYDRMELKKGVCIATAATIVARVCHETIPESVRTAVHHLLNCLGHYKAEKEWREKFQEKKRLKGEFIWSDEQTVYFQELLADEKYIRHKCPSTRERKSNRHKPYDHAALADAMNTHFDVTDFTPKRSHAKVDNLKVHERKGAHISELRSNVFRELYNTIAVTPFIVVPPEYLGEILAHDLR